MTGTPLFATASNCTTYYTPSLLTAATTATFQTFTWQSWNCSNTSVTSTKPCTADECDAWRHWNQTITLSYLQTGNALTYVRPWAAWNEPIEESEERRRILAVERLAFCIGQAAQAAEEQAVQDRAEAGDTNIVAVGWNDTTSSITSVTDTAGNVYHPAVATFRGNGLSQAIYYAANVAASPARGSQVTVTFGQAAAFVDLRVTEYSGLSATAPFDTGASASGSGDTASSGALATAGPSELLFAAGMTGTTFTAPGPGYTSRVVTAPDGDLVADAVAQSAGSYGARASLGSGTWLLQLAACAP
jgi:hypothetical protein